MSTTFSFIKGVGFTLALFAAYVAGFGVARDHYENQANEEDESESVQDVEVEETQREKGA